MAGNKQHHPDKPLHWDRSKSTDDYDALARHLIDAGTVDDDGIRHTAKVAWRALACLQKELENEKSNPINRIQHISGRKNFFGYQPKYAFASILLVGLIIFLSFEIFLIPFRPFLMA